MLTSSCWKKGVMCCSMFKNLKPLLRMWYCQGIFSYVFWAESWKDSHQTPIITTGCTKHCLPVSYHPKPLQPILLSLQQSCGSYKQAWVGGTAPTNCQENNSLNSSLYLSISIRGFCPPKINSSTRYGGKLFAFLSSNQSKATFITLLEKIRNRWGFGDTRIKINPKITQQITHQQTAIASWATINFDKHPLSFYTSNVSM